GAVPGLDAWINAAEALEEWGKDVAKPEGGGKEAAMDLMEGICEADSLREALDAAGGGAKKGVREGLAKLAQKKFAEGATKKLSKRKTDALQARPEPDYSSHARLTSQIAQLEAGLRVKHAQVSTIQSEVGAARTTGTVKSVPRPGGGEVMVRELDVLEVAWGCSWDTMRARMQVLTGHSTSDLYFTFNTDMDMGVWSAPGVVPTRALQKAMENLARKEQGHTG
ncbi:hypothetical protein T484DRAFT_1795561, partial [Baffinella frigidus]